jgi:hypothetical protein
LSVARHARTVLAQTEFAAETLDLVRACAACRDAQRPLGNWELVAQGGVANGIPITCVAKQIGSEAMTALLTRQRPSSARDYLG